MLVEGQDIKENEADLMWYIYIIKCSDNSYYIGHTNFLQERIETHNAGKAAKWTANRLPVKLVYNEIYTDKIQAIKRERQLKK
ncbi:MAG: GIY-YIG nuclease superfamily protein [Planctomycetes bacterium ADurb.Bin401]|nr:MAG: GIY-YIG nuclease superfamily protein [Planctomycetes bacterium ADurb.Bin401]